MPENESDEVRAVGIRMSDRAGTVYVVINDRDPYLVKVGCTKKSAEERARELRTTGVPSHFMVVFDLYVDDARAVEHAVHAELRDTRYEPDREFFTCGPKTAINTLLKHAHGRTMASPWSDTEVELLPKLVERYPSLLEPKLRSAAICVRDDGVVLRTVVRSWDEEVESIETPLGFIGGEEGPMFTSEVSARENARLFMSLTAMDLAHCTPLLREDLDEAAIDEADAATGS